MSSPLRARARHLSRATRAVVGALLLTHWIAVVWATIRLHEPVADEDQIDYRPIEVSGDGYVSSSACKSCHPSQYQSWHRSYHRTMTQVATPEAVRANFEDTQVAAVPGTPMRLERRGNEFWAELDNPDWDGRDTSSARIERQVVMITGSHHQQIYWYRTDQGRLLGQLPGMYLIGERRWIPRRSALMNPPGTRQTSETGWWNAGCINCHATHGKWKFDKPFGSQPIEVEAADTTVVEFGIACEACHGPSDRHVRLNRSPLRRYLLYLTERRDPTTVQPALLNPRVSSQVCGQCHGIWQFYGQEDEREANSHGLPYRPGDELHKTRFVAQPTQNAHSTTMENVLASDPGWLTDSFWSDGMVRVSGREYNGLIESPCFKNTTDQTRTMSCFSCHTMHKASDDWRTVAQWADTYQLSAGMDDNHACQQCHTSITSNVTAHSNHRADSTGSSCYNCHMPYTSYGLLRALRSHQISSPTVAASVQTGRPNACNLCHLDKTLGWTADYLEKWYVTPQVALNEQERTIAASLLWLLKGDAGQRALVAWSMGWPPAQQVSGTSWTAPFLSVLMDDPYDAVRFIAYQSLRSLPGLGDVMYDFVSPPRERSVAIANALAIWSRGGTSRLTNREILFDSQGSLQTDIIVNLLSLRNNRLVSLRE
jgi:hypothetical protein